MSNRAQRSQNAPTVLLQARVAPEVRQAVKEAAERSGVSVAYYMEKFVRDLVDAHGALPTVTHPQRQKETLNVPAA